MRRDKFNEFWVKLAQEWYTTTTVEVENKHVPVAELCTFRDNCPQLVYENYEFIKTVTKEFYFKNLDNLENKPCRISRYKRAAVLTYAIIKSNPLIFVQEKSQPWIDPYFLKQKLAFYMAIGSIVQEATESSIEKCLQQNKPIFDFTSLGNIADNIDCQDDTFLMSVYKDLLYSEVYDNFNILTMANLYGLLTEKASELKFQ